MASSIGLNEFMPHLISSVWILLWFINNMKIARVMCKSNIERHPFGIPNFEQFQMNINPRILRTLLANEN
jgi:hypothetical protein